MSRRVAIVQRLVELNCEVDRDTGCWEWQGRRRPDGYGLLSVEGENLRVHRLMYECHNDTVLDERTFVCHHCDNPCCVNPEHLFAGTQKDNMVDRKNKGRVPKGESHSLTRLTDDDVSDIRRMAKDGVPRKVIRTKYGISQAYCCQLINNVRRTNHVA